MIRIWAAPLLLALLALPLTSHAQDSGGLGLDLSDDSAKKDTKDTKQQPPPAESPGLDLSAPSTPATNTATENPANPATTPTATTEAAPKAEPQLFNESDITSEDRVKSVQRKVYLKKNRFELAPFVTISLNDPYFTKFGGSVRGSYFLADTLALSLRFTYLQFIRSDDLKIAGRTFQAIPAYSVPIGSGMVDAEWSPIYGKVAIFNSILHFDAYALGGVGFVYTETSKLPGRFAGDLGFGFRFVVRDFLAVNVAFINTSYVDTPASSNGKGATQNMLTLNAGISLFLPFSSTGREAE